MERRQFLRTLTAAVAGSAVAGCSEGGGPGTLLGETTPTEPADRPGDGGPNATEDPTPTGTVPEAPVADEMTGWERREHQEASAFADEPPTVAFEPGEDRLFVRGVLIVGSSSCKEASVETVEYGDGELYVAVIHDWKESAREDTPRECTSDVSEDAYEVAVTFDDGLPARVVAAERDYDADERRSVYER